MDNAIVKIEKMAFGGAGFGRLDGKACFVPFTAPGDIARIRITVEKVSYLEGELIDLEIPSSQRVSPPCPVFGMCGGCTWQHLGYSAQLAAKEAIFTETLWRSGRVEPEIISPIVGTDSTYGYRCRVQFKARWSAGRLHIGFYRRSSHYVIDIPGGCAIAHPKINNALTEVRHVLLEFPEPDKIPQIDAATGDNGETILIIHYIGENRSEAAAFFENRRAGMTSVSGLHLQYGRKSTIEKVYGIDKLSYTIPGSFFPEMQETRLSFSRGGFSQVNYQQNLELLRGVYRLVNLRGVERLLDVYCGNGNFAIPLSRYAAEVIGVEEYEPSIEDAKSNAVANGLGNVQFVCVDAVKGVTGLHSQGKKFDVVILDPPRTGAKDAVREIAALRPERIVYVSCDPATLGRDVGLLKLNNYRVVTSFPVDMFPQTYHIESVTLLQRIE